MAPSWTEPATREKAGCAFYHDVYRNAKKSCPGDGLAPAGAECIFDKLNTGFCKPTSPAGPAVAA